MAEFVINRANGTSQKVTLEAPSTVGLPAASDNDFLIALLELARHQEFKADIVRFVPSRLLHAMQLAPTRKNYLRLKNALKRLRAVTVTYEQAWYNRVRRGVEPILITGILAEAKLVLRRGRPPANAVPDSYVQWTRNFHTSLKEGNLTDLDLDLYFEWTRPGAKELHRHLNKVWHCGRKPRVYERDLKELACAHLGMKECKDLKRNLHQIIREMEDKQYLLSLDETVRYRRVCPGVWRVRLELHASRYRGKPARGGESESDAARKLVCEYHRHRFGRKTYEPKQHELKHAATLLRNHEPPVLLRLVPIVARLVEASYHGTDCHFGAAVAQFELATQKQAEREHWASSSSKKARPASNASFGRLRATRRVSVSSTQ